jgi:hypothetical protein
MSIHPADLLSLSPLLKLGKGIPRHPDQLGRFTPASDGFCGVMTVPEGVFVADRSAASSRAAMHPTTALSPHRRRLARFPAPRPGSTSGIGTVSSYFSLPPPPGLTAPTIARPTGVDVDTLDRHLLLPFATIALQGLYLRRVGAQ